MKSLKQIICTIYLAVLFIVYPLFQHDHYYSMGDNKYKFYLISTLIFFVLLAISIITDPDTYKYKPGKNSGKNASKRSGKNKKTNAAAKSSEKPSVGERALALKDKFIEWYSPKSIVEKFVWAYLLFAIISYIFSIDKYIGFFGADGWYMGLMMQCIMIAGFFIFAKVWEPDMLPFYFSMFGSSLVMLLGIVMRFGIDPLGNYEGLEQMYINMFISTIGQTSWYSAYICTVIPIGVGLFFVAENRKTRIISMIYSIISFMALCIADSDSVYLAIAGMLMILFWVAFTNEKYMIRFFETTTLLAGSFVLMEGIKIALSDYYNAEVDLTSIKTTDIKLYALALVASLIILIALVALNKGTGLSKIYEHTKPLHIFRGAIYIAVALAVVAVIAGIALNTLGIIEITAPGSDDRSNLFVFNDLWGNARGIAWRLCWIVFSDYSIGRKLVGVGPDCLTVVTQVVEEYAAILRSIYNGGEVLTAAHNEFYNHIVVYGLLGGLSYLGIYVSGIISYCKSFAKKPIAVVAAACIAAYMGHNLFCYQTVICTPFILVIMGIVEAFLNKDK